MSVTTLDLIAAAMFSVMGVALVVIGITGTTLAPTAQVTIGIWLQDRLVPFVGWLAPVPDWVIGLALVAMAGAAVAISGRRRKLESDSETSPDGSCHDEQEEPTEAVDEGDHSCH